jgi:hypothetical protein
MGFEVIQIYANTGFQNGIRSDSNMQTQDFKMGFKVIQYANTGFQNGI